MALPNSGWCSTAGVCRVNRVVNQVVTAEPTDNFSLHTTPFQAATHECMDWIRAAGFMEQHKISPRLFQTNVSNGVEMFAVGLEKYKLNINYCKCKICKLLLLNGTIMKSHAIELNLLLG